MDVDAAGAADFPGDGAEGLLGMGGEHAVQGGAVALHFDVGGGSGEGVGDAGEGRGVREGDDEDVGGTVERGECSGFAEGAFGGGEVGVGGDGGD